ncbi:hypothetical protein HMPREF1982_03407 [Clostridiales bacterium oral taxon 876 str. F0540]|nr:hypothetical protein HMPREF1982_03407 [Clostridiales bacterium oral taxon 876 str. F0540]
MCFRVDLVLLQREKLSLTVRSIMLWRLRIKPSKEPKLMPSPVKAQPRGIPLGDGSGISRTRNVR